MRSEANCFLYLHIFNLNMYTVEGEGRVLEEEDKKRIKRYFSSAHKVSYK